jgi:hypothetical protein
MTRSKGRHSATPASDRTKYLVSRTWGVLFPTWRALATFVLTGVLAPILLLSVHVAQNPLLSPIDEITHYDYVNRIAEGNVPRFGQYLLPSSVQQLECRGIALPSVTANLPPCGTRIPSPVISPLRDTIEQYEAQQPPAYYALTVPLRWVAVHVFGFSDLTGTRLTGVIWLVTGLSVFWAAARVLGLSVSRIGAGVLLISTAPLVVTNGSYVTNDASAILAGSLVLLAGALAWRRPGPWVAPVLFLIGAFATSLKAVDLLAVAIGSLLLAVLAFATPSTNVNATFWSKVFDWAPNGGALLLGGGVAAIAWVVTSHQLALVDPAKVPTWEVLRGSANGFTVVVREALSLLTPLTGASTPFRSSNGTISAESARTVNLAPVLATVLGYVTLAGGLSGLFIAPRRWFHWMGLVTVPSLYVGGVALGYVLHYSYKIDPQVGSRYGLAVAPFLVLALVGSATGQWVVRGLWTLGSITLVMSCYFMLST